MKSNTKSESLPSSLRDPCHTLTKSRLMTFWPTLANRAVAPRTKIRNGRWCWANGSTPKWRITTGYKVSENLFLNYLFKYFLNYLFNIFWLAEVPDHLGAKTLTTQTTAGPSVLPNKPKITTRQTMTGPSVSAMDSSQVVDILFPARADTSNTSAISWKASPSNPNKIIIPRLSMEQLPPWEK